MAALLLCVVLVTAAQAQPLAIPDTTDAPAAAPELSGAPVAGALHAGIGLVEVRLDNGGREVSLPFGDIPQDVDINSVVRIQVQAHRIASALGPGPVLAPPQVRQLVVASQALRDAAPQMLEAFESAARLVEMEAREGRNDKRFDALATQAQVQFRALSDASRQYGVALEAGDDARLRQHASEFEAARNVAIETASDTATPDTDKPAILAALLVDESDWIVAELERRGLEAAQRLRGVALVLFAVSMSDGTPQPQHLEHYDNLPAGVPVPYEKIRAVPSPEDEAALREIYAEAQAWVGVLEDLRTRRTSLGVALRSAALQLGLDVEPLLAALREARRALRQVDPTAWADAASAPSTRAAVLKARRTLDALTSTDFLDSLASAPSPVDGLVLVLRRMDASGRLLAEGLHELQRFAATAEMLPELMTAQVDSLRDALGRVAAEASVLAEKAATLFGAKGPALEAYAAADFNVPDTSFHVSGDRLKDTYLDLRTLAGRREGDTVVIVAKLYRVSPVEDEAGGARAVIGEELDSEAQTLRMLRFGFYTAPGGGPAYVVSSFRREGGGPHIRQFAPMVAWMLRHRGWPRLGDGTRPQRAGSPWLVGVGVHTLVLDLNGDNQQEIGAGAAVSFYGDLLQFGCGWDFGLRDSPYWYVGFRLVSLGKGAGTESVGGG